MTPFPLPYHPHLDQRWAWSLSQKGPVAALLSSPSAASGLNESIVGPIDSYHDVVDLTQANLELWFTPAPLHTKVVLLGYELGRSCVELPGRAPPPGEPLARIALLSTVLRVNHATQSSTVWVADPSTRDAAAAEISRAPIPPHRKYTSLSIEPTVSDDEHQRRILRAQEWIRAGEVYQANVTRQMNVAGPSSLCQATLALLEHNPVAHAAYLGFPDLEIASNSMETLLRYKAATQIAESRPIKGTWPRPHDAPSQAPAAFLANTKERAEHVMIVDLVRNDLGRLSTPGSVEVSEFMAAEAYRGVWHAVSTVKSHIRDPQRAGSLVRSLFPGGSIIGTPKRRAMELLADLEGVPRGLYTGSIAVVHPNGDISMSILIRTLIRTGRGQHGHTTLGVGGGIVFDSDPSREVAETWAKIRVFQDVLGVRI